MSTELDTRMRDSVFSALTRVGIKGTLSPRSVTHTPGSAPVAVTSKDVAVKLSPLQDYERDTATTTGAQGGQPAARAVVSTTYIAAKGLSVVPKKGDRLTANGEDFSIDSIREERSGDLVAAFFVRLAR